MKRTNYTQLIAALSVVALTTSFNLIFCVRQAMYLNGNSQALTALWLAIIVFVISGGLVTYLLIREKAELHNPPASWWRELSFCVLYGIALFLFLRLFTSHWRALPFGAMLAAILVKI